jgi:hypothetical protein
MPPQPTLSKQLINLPDDVQDLGQCIVRGETIEQASQPAKQVTKQLPGTSLTGDIQVNRGEVNH